jgi:NADPH:quinone reductase-like Zn-dependent oxidoreductase
VSYIENGQIKPLLSGTYRLSDFHRAQSDFMGKHFVGKLVVVPDSKWEVVGSDYAA